MEAVNLLPAYARPGHPWATVGKDLSARRVLAVGGAVAGAAALVFGGAFVYERSVVNDKQDTLARVQTQLVAAQAKAEPLRAIQSESVTKLGAVRTISQERIPWENVLRDLSRILPSRVQLQTLQIQSSTPFAPANVSTTASTGGSSASSAAAAAGFTVTGSASSQNRVALVLDRLAALPWLSGVTLQSSTHAASGSSGSTGGDQFTINATFNFVGGTR
jgi:Tfp pilus assembly protein PilN